jgi:hypothetical protein
MTSMTQSTGQAAEPLAQPTRRRALQRLRQLLAGMGLNSDTRELVNDPSADHPDRIRPPVISSDR